MLSSNSGSVQPSGVSLTGAVPFAYLHSAPAGISFAGSSSATSILVKDGRSRPNCSRYSPRKRREASEYGNLSMPRSSVFTAA